MSKMPFLQETKNNKLIREFSENVSSNELVWHRDRTDRQVLVTRGDGWQLQMENELPKKLIIGESYFIPKNTYHRLIKGTSNLIVEISESQKPYGGIIEDPPEETIEELNQVIHQYYNRYNSEDMQEVLDKKMEAVFDSILKMNGIPSMEDLILDLKYTTLEVVMNLKNFYKRKRPDEVAKDFGVDWQGDGIKMDTDDTFSYPSGHACQAYYIAHNLSDMFPKLRDTLMQAAEMVSQSRIDRGVHFRSDCDAGRQLAHKLHKENRVLESLRKYVSEILNEDANSFMNAMADLQSSGKTPVTRGSEIMDMDFLNRLAIGKRLKRTFAEHADHNFLGSLNTVHWTGDEYALNYLMKAGGKDELSTTMSRPGESFRKPKRVSYGLWIRGRITYAANNMDKIHSGHQKDYYPRSRYEEQNWDDHELRVAKQRKKSSGINKSPMKNPVDFEDLKRFSDSPRFLERFPYVLDAETFNPKDGVTNEALVDNWRPIGIIATDKFIVENIAKMQPGSKNNIGRTKRLFLAQEHWNVPIYDISGNMLLDKPSSQEAVTSEALMRENYIPTYRYLYHGTTEEAAEKIKASGFDISLVGKKSGDSQNPGVSFTIDGDQAAEHSIWAMDGDFSNWGGVVVVNAKNLNIMPGKEYNRLWDEMGSRMAAINYARSKGFDGVEYFDLDTGEGIEEMEVLLLNPSKISVSHVNYINPEDYPDIMEEYQ